MGVFLEFGHIGESRESPISEYGIPRVCLEESIGNTHYIALDTRLVSYTPINERLYGALKRHYTLAYREDHLPRGGYLFF